MSGKTAAKRAPAQSNARLTEMEQSIKSTNEKVDSLVETVGQLASVIIDASKAKDNPVISNNYLESQEQDLGAEGAASFGENSDDSVIERPSENETENFTSEKHRDIAFNGEILTVQIHETSDKDADQVFEIIVNGQSEIFRRGETKRVRRIFVEGLARAKPINYGNEEYMGSDGMKHVRYPTHKGLRYPFALVNPTPRDSAWLQSILAQP